MAQRHYDITLDGERISREFLLVEVLNTPSIGPKFELTADVNAADGHLSVVLLGESDRDALIAYYKALGNGRPRRGWDPRRVKTIRICPAPIGSTLTIA